MPPDPRATRRVALAVLALAGAALAASSLVRTSPPTRGAPPTLRLDPTTAPPSVLLALPGVGPERAASIVAHRPYANLADLDARVPGLGPKRTAALAPHLRFDAPAAPGADPR